MTKRLRSTGVGLTALALTLLLGACGGDGGADGVATLGGENASSASDNGSGSGDGGELTEEETQEAFRKFAQCMRDHGVNMPDPQFEGGTDGGGLIVRGDAAAGSEDAEPERVEEADKACQQHLQGVVDSRKGQLDPEEEERMKQRALDFAKCMREHGIDMPDPQFGEGGKVTQQIGGPDGGGIDPTDPEFQEAQEECADEAGMPKGGPGERIGVIGGSTKDSQ